MTEITSFDRFYSCYPRKTARATAVKAWDKAVKKQPNEAEFVMTVVLAIDAQVRHRERLAKAGETFIPDWPHPATWLNGERWLDQLQELKDTAPSGKRFEAPRCQTCQRQPSVLCLETAWVCAWCYETAYCNDGILGLNVLRARWRELTQRVPRLEQEPHRAHAMRMLRELGLWKNLPTQLQTQVTHE